MIREIKDQDMQASPACAKPLVSGCTVNKKGFKYRIFEWIKKNDNESVRLQDIKQTNISFQKYNYQESYYFTTGGVLSPYTMKRWLEIADNKLYDNWNSNHGTWYWIKDNVVVA